MKIFYRLILLISLIGLSRDLHSQPVCGIDDPFFICVEGMTACAECNLYRPGPGFPGNPNPIKIPEVPVDPPIRDPNFLPEDPIRPIPPIGTPNTQLTPKQLVLKNAKFDPCQSVTRANDLTRNQDFRNRINQIKDKSVEYGAAIKLRDPNDPNSVSIDPPSTDNNVSNKNVRPTWDAKNGYVVGYIHNHPGEGSPSPSDLFNAAVDIMELVNSSNIPANQLEIYLRNFSSSVVSGGNVYTITISNAQLFSIMSGNFNSSREAANSQYKNAVADFIDRHYPNGTSTEDYQAAGESAILKMYGNMINLSKQKIGETDRNKAIKRDKNGNISKVNPCTN
jgi:hypothetical protein